MPVIINPENMSLELSGLGWKITALAEKDLIGTDALGARRWSLEPSAKTSQFEHGSSEQLLYVISGDGSAVVNGDTLPLGVETMLWLEPGDSCQFLAGEGGIEILQGYTPGD